MLEPLKRWLRSSRLKCSLTRWVWMLPTQVSLAETQRLAEERLKDYLAQVQQDKSGLARLSTDDMLDVAEEANTFLVQPYWRRMTVMLDRTISSEFEEMLQGEGTRELNRAAIVVARKMLRMPLIDVEQGKLAVKAVERQQTALGDIFTHKRDLARMGRR